MARTNAVWGIDVGQCALKALRCSASADPDKIVVEAFDFIEYPKILSQPDAEPAQLIADALRQFLSRNQVSGDRVAISVSGQSGLARFIKLPPVEAKKIPDIVRYEARQQIPFDLNDVIWDYQRMGGGSEEEGFALETEVGLFAMKRDAVFRAIEPFQQAGIELDYVQLTPLALYNYVFFDQLRDLPPIEEYDPENPPESVVVVSLGTDSTDLVVTNGYRVWQRSVPLGGNHFTKALTKELKLTFAKAEHLKRNATTAQDPKAIFQAMRPVFNDLLTELQRSLSFFSNVDRNAKLGRIVALGNAFKLPGLRRYLSQSLGFDIKRVESFRGLEGPEVINAPSFKENILSFGVCYGLVLQGLGKGGLKTNLLPKQIVRDRLIRQKKPWAVAATATLMLACGLAFAVYSTNWNAVSPREWNTAEQRATTVTAHSTKLLAETETIKNEYLGIKQIGDHLVSNIEGRAWWLELLLAINESLPRDDPRMPPKEIRDRYELHITNLECQQVDDVAKWYEGVKKWKPASIEAAPATVAVSPSGNPAPGAAGPGNLPGPPPIAPIVPTADHGPIGPGWIVQITGYHYHNSDPIQLGAKFVTDTLIKNLVNGAIKLPTGEKDLKTGEPLLESVSLKDLGISYPILIEPGGLEPETIPNPNPIIAGDEAGGGGNANNQRGRSDEHPANPNDSIKVNCFKFRVQFCWQPTLTSKRHAAKQDQKAAVAGN